MSTVVTQRSNRLKLHINEFSEQDLRNYPKDYQVVRARPVSGSKKFMVFNKGTTHITEQTLIEPWERECRVAPMPVFFIARWVGVTTQNRSVRLVCSIGSKPGYWSLKTMILDPTFQPTW